MEEDAADEARVRGFQSRSKRQIRIAMLKKNPLSFSLTAGPFGSGCRFPAVRQLLSKVPLWQGSSYEATLEAPREQGLCIHSVPCRETAAGAQKQQEVCCAVGRGKTKS